jgi:2-polyprenyl-3-methyl-5-hydroxy-6-metoxy-1,4-benzoquinol methylase
MSNVIKVTLSERVQLDCGIPQKVTSDRLSPLLDLAKNRKVINIGCCGSDVLANNTTVHGKIAAVASDCVGIDIFEEGANKLRHDGHNVFLANAESFELDQNDFDLAILGDIIEHLANPGLALDRANMHLKLGGLVAVSTPNPFAISLTTQILRKAAYDVNSEHTLWFDPVMLCRIMERSGFEPIELIWTQDGETRRLAYYILKKLRRSFHETFIVVGRKVRLLKS